MTIITDVAPRIHYTATAGQTVFTIPFEWVADSDIDVYVNGVKSVFQEPPADKSHYSLTLSSGTSVAGGSLAFGPPGRTAGDLVVIVRDKPVQRTIDLPTTGVFPVPQLNDTFDAITQMIQKNESDIAQRTLRLSVADQPATLSNLPSLAARKDKVLGFNSSGQPIALDKGSLGGSIVNADTLDGQDGSYYLDRSNHTGVDEIADINGLAGALALKADINSPVLTGDPRSVTPPLGDDDTSIATTAFVQASLGTKLGDAPADALTYGRRNGSWVEAVPEAVSDDRIYGRRNKAWIEVTGGGGGGGAKVNVDVDPPATPIPGDLWWDSDSGVLYIWYNDGTSGQWVQVASPAAFDTSRFLTETWGDWTPALVIGSASGTTGITHTTQTGRWRKSGKMVDLWFDCLLANKGALVGSVYIAGSSFAAAPSAAGLSYSGSVSYYRDVTAATVYGLGCHLVQASPLISLTGATVSAPQQTALQSAAITNTFRVIGHVNYEVA